MAVYLILLNMSIEKPVLLPVSSHELTKAVASTSERQNIKISDVNSSMENLLKEGISEKTFQRISSARCPGSLSNYNLHWSQWVIW